MYICICICMYIYIYVCMCVCVYICVCVYYYTYTYIHTYIYLYLWIGRRSARAARAGSRRHWGGTALGRGWVANRRPPRVMVNPGRASLPPAGWAVANGRRAILLSASRAVVRRWSVAARRSRAPMRRGDILRHDWYYTRTHARTHAHTCIHTHTAG